MVANAARLERDQVMDNHVQLKIDWKCRKCGTLNEMNVTRRNIAQIDHQLKHKCTDCKVELSLSIVAHQEESKW